MSRPTFSIINKGVEKSGDYAPILEELVLTDSTTEKADAIKIKISDIGNRIELPTKGEKITVSIGQDGTMTRTGIYVIDGVRLVGPPDIIEITGAACPFSDADTLTAMQSRKSRSWDNITLGQLVSGIAGEHGLTAAVSSEFAPVNVPHVDQTAESDNNLLTRMARLYGAVFKPTFQKLVFTRGGEGNTSTGAPVGTLAIARGIGMKYDATFSKRTNFTGAKVCYHDCDAGETGDFTAGLNDDEKKLYREGKLEASAPQAKAKAWSKLRELKRGSQIVTVDLPGCWKATAEQKVSLTGWRKEINGIWIAKKVVFTLTRGAGWRTKIDCEIPVAPSSGTAEGPDDGGSLFGVDEQNDAATPGAEDSDASQESATSDNAEEQDTSLPVPGALPEP